MMNEKMSEEKREKRGLLNIGRVIKDTNMNADGLNELVMMICIEYVFITTSNNMK